MFEGRGVYEGVWRWMCARKRRCHTHPFRITIMWKPVTLVDH